MADPTLAEAAAELALEAPHDDPQEAAAWIAQELAAIRPDTTARGRQRAAAGALGIAPPPSSSDAAAELDQLPANRARDAARRRARVAARSARSSSPGKLFGYGVRLVALYWLLVQGPRVVRAAADAATNAFRWLRDPSAVIE